MRKWEPEKNCSVRSSYFITCKNEKFNFNDAQQILFFEVIIVQCQNTENSIKYTLLRSLYLTLQEKIYYRPRPLELQILLEEQTASEILFLSYAATTTIDRMIWLARISHYIRGHVHKAGHNYNGTYFDHPNTEIEPRSYSFYKTVRGTGTRTSRRFLPRTSEQKRDEHGASFQSSPNYRKWSIN